MFGFWEAILAHLTRQVGLRTDAADAAGSLHAKVALSILPQNTLLLFRPFGAGNLGDVTISSNTTLNKFQAYHYRNLTVASSITLTAGYAFIFVANQLTVNGLITASGLGAPGGPAQTAAAAGIKGSDGIGFAGAGGGGGGDANTGGCSGGAGGSTYICAGGNGGSLAAGGSGQGILDATGFWHPDYLLRAAGGGGGSGGTQYSGTGYSGAGGAGGGAIFICAKNILINSGGAIRAEGINGGSASRGGGGGGGGGLIWLFYQTLTNYGTISANGGIGGSGFYSGGAGGNGNVILIQL